MFKKPKENQLPFQVLRTTMTQITKNHTDIEERSLTRVTPLFFASLSISLLVLSLWIPICTRVVSDDGVMNGQNLF